jgi:spore germination protein
MVCFLFALSTLTACGAQIIDELGLVDVIAYDVSDDEQEPLQVTINYPTITQDGEFDNKTLSTNAKSSKDSRMKFQNETNLHLVSGQVGVALFGEELAEKGLNDILDTFMRDPSIGARVMLAIGEGKAKDLLMHKQGGVVSATYIRTFLEHISERKESTVYNMFQFVRDMHDEGSDSVIPYFSMEDKKIKLNGYALFKGDRYVKKLSNDESRILFLLRKDVPKGTFTINIDESEEKESKVLMFDYHQQRSEIAVKMSRGQPVKADIYIDIEGSVLEYSGKEGLDEEKNQRKLEKKINAYLNEKSTELIAILQEEGVDPLSIGSHVRSKMKYNEWKEMNWEEIYQAMDIAVHTRMKFMDIGKAK